MKVWHMLVFTAFIFGSIIGIVADGVVDSRYNKLLEVSHLVDEEYLKNSLEDGWISNWEYTWLMSKVPKEAPTALQTLKERYND